MSAFDFDRFRKYVADDVPVPSPWRPPVGEGWHAMIFEALAKIDAIVGGDAAKFRIDQVKEKFGALRFYCSVDDESVREQVFAIAREIEERSATMCESCGAPAQIFSYGGWYGSLCPMHAMLEIEDRKMKIGATGWRLGRIDGRPAIVDKATGGEIGDEKFEEIEARVAATRRVLEVEEKDRRRGQKSAVGSIERSETVFWRHAKYVASWNEKTRGEPGHRYDAEQIKAAVDDHIENLELPFSIAGVARGERPREWKVSIYWSEEKRWVETWVEDPGEGDDVERVVERGSVRIGQVRSGT